MAAALASAAATGVSRTTGQILRTTTKLTQVGWSPLGHWTVWFGFPSPFDCAADFNFRPTVSCCQLVTRDTAYFYYGDFPAFSKTLQLSKKPQSTVACREIFSVAFCYFKSRKVRCFKSEIK